MQRLKHLFVIIMIALCFPVYAASPAGTWTTIDDTTGKKRAVVKLVETNGILTGTIEKIYPQPGDTGLCTKCPDNFRNKPVTGLQFLWGLKHNKNNIWDGGRILDAKSGKIYRVKITVKGNKLYVRGYIGIALLGRTQVWTRDD
jgi:uncharacterized protein (DUF2147 family)